jgi:hypothetical protein
MNRKIFRIGAMLVLFAFLVIAASPLVPRAYAGNSSVIVGYNISVSSDNTSIILDVYAQNKTNPNGKNVLPSQVTFVVTLAYKSDNTFEQFYQGSATVSGANDIARATFTAQNQGPGGYFHTIRVYDAVTGELLGFAQGDYREGTGQ